MPPGVKQCKICLHPDRPAIDAALSQGLTLRGCQARWPDFSYVSVLRHRKNHLVPMLQSNGLKILSARDKTAAHIREEAAYAGSLVQRVQEGRRHAEGAQRLARELAFLAAGKNLDGTGVANPKDFDIAIKAAKLLVDANHGVLRHDEVSGRATGEISPGQTNILVAFQSSPEGKELLEKMARIGLTAFEAALSLVDVGDEVRRTMIEEYGTAFADGLEKYVPRLGTSR